MKKINWPLVLLAYFSLFCLGIADNGRGAIYPDILNKLNLTYENGSILFSISSFCGLISTLTAKNWLSRYGIINPQRFFSLLLFFATLTFGLSISVVPSFTLALIGSSLIGVTMGGLSITMNLSIDQGVPEQYRRKFLSGLHSLYGLSSGFAPVILLFLSSWEKSYQELYFVIALFPIILFLLSFKVKTNNLDDLKNDSPLTFNDHHSTPLSSIILIGSVLSLYVCSEVLLSSRFIIISNSLGLKNNNAAQSYLSSFFILLTLGRIIFAFIKTKKTNFIMLIASILISLIFFIIALLTKSPIFLSLIGLSMSIYFPCAMDYIAQKFKGNLQKSLPMIMNIVTIKLILMHFLAGIIEEKYGAQSTLYLSITFLCLAFICLISQRRKI
jgi:MFS transporter, FHS family, glucose/mannose:H+ symporter